MLIIKNIEIAIDVTDPIGLYTDPDNIMNILTNRYEGRCYRGCFIKKINKIMRTGECIINQDGSPNFGTLSIIIEVTAIIFPPGEIVNGAVVQNKDENGTIMCSTDTACIFLLGHVSLASVTKGQIISVRVKESKYPQGIERASISAIPYLFTDRVAVFKMNTLSPRFDMIAESILATIAEEETHAARLQKEQATPWKFFDQLLYGYTTAPPAPPGAKLVNILDLVRSHAAVPNYLSLDARLPGSSPIVYAYDTPKFPEKSVVMLEVPSDAAVISLLEAYYNHLRTIREMIEIYHTEPLVISHRNLWQIFKKAKLN